jgi:hypothetical protein
MKQRSRFPVPEKRQKQWVLFVNTVRFGVNVGGRKVDVSWPVMAEVGLL